MKPLTPKKAAQIIDFLTIETSQILENSGAFLVKLADELENINAHSEWTVLQALRYGTEEDIRESREILHGHLLAGELTPELSRRRHALNRKLSGITTETEAEKLIPPAIAMVTVPASLIPLVKHAVTALNESVALGLWASQHGNTSHNAGIWHSTERELREILNTISPQ